MVVILIFTLLTGCSGSMNHVKQHISSSTSSSWVYDKMITWNGNIYVATSEKVEKVGRKIGIIKYFSDKETSSSIDSSSNY